MRWPWITTAEFEPVIQGMVEARNERAAAQRRYDDLLAKYHELRVNGAEAPAPQAAVRPAPEPSLSDEAISERAGRNAGLRRHLTAERDRQRAKGMDEESLADHVTNWASEVDD